MSSTLSSTNTVTTASPPITITPAAALKSWEFINETKDPNLKMRVGIIGGGCQGLQYKITFAEKIEEDDILIKAVLPNTSDKKLPSTVDWVVGPNSFVYLKGVEIDYVRSAMDKENFVFRNLKIKTRCGCGDSFSLEE